MFLAVSLLASLGVLVSTQAGEPACPPAWQSYHVQYLNARLQENVQLENDLFVYQLHINTPENGYEPGNTYDLRLRVNARGEHTPMRGFVVVATPLDAGEPHCGFGRFGEDFPGVRTRPGCPHVLMNDGFAEKMYVGFNWTAPTCGCVKIRATVITDVSEFYIDTDTATEGPLTTTVCPFNHVQPYVDEDDDDSVLDVLDLEFFGMEEDEDEEEEDEDSLSALEVLLLEAIGVDSELIDVHVEDGDDVDDSDLVDDGDDDDDDDDDDDGADGSDEDDEDEDEDDDEGGRRGGGRRRDGGFRQRGPGWRRGMQRRRNRDEGEDEDDLPGRRGPPMHHRPGRHHQRHHQGPRRRRPGPGGNMDAEDDNERRFGGRFGPRHGSRFGKQRRYRRRQMTMTEKVEHVCERIQGPARLPQRRGHRQLNDTAREARQQMFERHHHQIRNCCSLAEMVEKVECFEDLREARFNRICAGQESFGIHRHRRRRMGRQEQDVDEEEDDARQQPEWMQECCTQTDEERHTCFNESVRERIAERRDRKKVSIEQRIERLNDTDHRLQVVCRKLQLPAPPRRRLASQMDEDEVTRWQGIWDERREEMRECCEVENAEERDECMHDIRDRRFEKVCRGAEPLRPVTPRRDRDTQAEALETCCDSEDEDRLQCIKGKIGGHFGGRWHRRVQILSRKLRHLENVTPSGLRSFFRRRFSRRNETANVEIVREELAPQDDLVIIHYGAAEDQQAGQDNVEDEGGEQSREEEEEEEEEEERENHPRRRTIRHCCEAGERRGQEPHNVGVCIRAAKQFAKRSPHFKFACKKAFTKCCIGDGAREPGPRRIRGGRRAGPRAARNRGHQ